MMNLYFVLVNQDLSGSLCFKLLQVQLSVILGVFTSQDFLFHYLELLVGLFVLAHHPQDVHNQTLI